MTSFRKRRVLPFEVTPKLSQMIEAQENILKHYISIEGMPEYPLGDMGDKENQKLLRDFCGRFTEELGEAFEVYNKLLELVYNPEDTESKPFKGIDNKEFRLTLKDYNEEIADAIHFLLELLIFCNVGEYDIKKFLFSILEDDGFEPGSNTEYETLDLLFQVSRNYIIKNGLKPTSIQVGYSIHDDDLLVKGGNCINQYLMDESHTFLWKTTYWVQMFKNSLKNKAWKQTQVETDEGRLTFSLYQILLHFFVYLDLMGFTSKSVWAVYMTKNDINYDRIKNKR